MPAPVPQDPERVGSSAHFVAYANAASPIDLAAEGKGPCKRIRVAAAGTLVVKRASDNVAVTLTFLAGESMDVQANTIDSGTATGIVVFW